MPHEKERERIKEEKDRQYQRDLERKM